MVEGAPQQMDQNLDVMGIAQNAFMLGMNDLKDVTKWARINNDETLFAYNASAEPNCPDKLKIEMYIDRPPEELCNFMFENMHILV